MLRRVAAFCLFVLTAGGLGDGAMDLALDERVFWVFLTVFARYFSLPVLLPNVFEYIKQSI